MKLIRTLVCRLFHDGHYEERLIDERQSGLRIETVLVRSCAVCQRVLYAAPAARSTSPGDQDHDARFCYCGAPRGHFGSEWCRPKPSFLLD